MQGKNNIYAMHKTIDLFNGLLGDTEHTSCNKRWIVIENVERVAEAIPEPPSFWRVDRGIHRSVDSGAC